MPSEIPVPSTYSRIRRLGLCAPLLAASTISLAQQQPAAPPQHESIVVTGSPEPLPLDEADRSVVSLPVQVESLLLSGLADVLKSDASIDLRERAPGVQADLSIRGSGFGQTLVLLNGLRLNDAQSGHHDMDIPLPLDAVTRVEVLHGSGSTLYGSDAVAGAINLIAAPPGHPEVRLRTAVGNFGTNEESGSAAAGAGPFSEELLFARGFSTGFMPDRDYRNLQLASLTGISTGMGAGNLTLAYMDHPFGADQFYGNFNSWEDTKTWFAGYQQAIGDRTEVELGFRRHSDLFVLLRDQPDVYANHHSDLSEQFAVRRREPLASRISFFYGLEGIHESIVSNNLGTHARSRAAAYAGVEFRALRRFSLSVTAREEAYRRFSGEFSPTVAGGAWLTSRWKLRASASRAFRVPSYTDLYYEDPANLGNPNLRPERTWSYEAGLDWNPAGRVSAEATVFERRERDGIDYYRASPDDLWRALNIDNLKFTGVEAALRIRLRTRQSLDVRYTALRAVQDTVALGSTKYSFDDPKQSAVVQWQAELPGGVIARTRVGALARYGQSAYALWDAYAAFPKGRIHPFVQVANITSTSYQEIQGVVMPGRTVLGGLEFVWRPQ